MKKKIFTPQRLCQILGSVVFLERFLEKMKEQLQSDKLELRIIISHSCSFLECERWDEKLRGTCKTTKSIDFIGKYHFEYFWVYLGILHLWRKNDDAFFARSESENFYEIVKHLEDQVRYLESKIKSKKKSVRLIISHPKSFFECKIGDESLSFPLITHNNGNKIISYPGPHIKIANKRTM
jgi:hypothetical protein